MWINGYFTSCCVFRWWRPVREPRPSLQGHRRLLCRDSYLAYTHLTHTLMRSRNLTYFLFLSCVENRNLLLHLSLWCLKDPPPLRLFSQSGASSRLRPPLLPPDLQSALSGSLATPREGSMRPTLRCSRTWTGPTGRSRTELKQLFLLFTLTWSGDLCCSQTSQSDCRA